MSQVVARTLRELRLELGPSIRQMEAKTAIPRSILSQIERGRIVAMLVHEETR